MRNKDIICGFLVLLLIYIVFQNNVEGVSNIRGQLERNSVTENDLPIYYR